MAKYKDAIEWIAFNDDTEWLDSEFGSPSVSACLIADLFNKPIEKIVEDIRATIVKYNVPS